MSSGSYLSVYEDAFEGAVDFDTDTFYAMLTLGYTPNFTTHTRRSDVTGEIIGIGYTAGGQAVTATVSKNTGAGTVTANFAATSWAGSTISADGCVYYKRRGGASSADELVGYDDFGGTVSSVGAAFNVAASNLVLTRVT